MIPRRLMFHPKKVKVVAVIKDITQNTEIPARTRH
jgi:hypothetical protein